MSTKGGRSDRTYEVGYGKPPKEWRFGADRQPDRATRQRAQARVPDIAGLLDRPITVQLNGKPTKIHPHRAMLHGLFRRVAANEIRAIKQFLQECKRAGLLVPSSDAPTGGVLVIPKGVPMDLAAYLVRIAGPPPWDAELYAELRDEYARDCADLEELKQLEIAKVRANGQEAY
jgi:hypothetical protein